jgi:hypothetical protein
LSVIQLHKAAPCDDIVRTLRVIADELESGEHNAAEWPATTAVLILAHESERPEGENVTMRRCQWTTHGFGPRNDLFSVRGILATVLGNGFDSDDAA